jgi:hypothetical protein
MKDKLTKQQRLEQSLVEMYDACKSILVMLEFYEELQLDVEFYRIDSPRLILIRQAVINAEILLKEMSDDNF